MSRWRVARRVLAEMFRIAPGAVAMLVPLGVLAAVARMLAAGVLLQFVTAFVRATSGPRLDVLGFDVGVDVDATNTWFWVAVIAATSVSAALSGYVLAIAELRLGRRYAEHAARRTLDLVVDDSGRGPIDFDPSSFVFGAAGLIGMLVPAVQAIVFGTVMLMMRPGTSLLLFAVAVVFLGPITVVTGNRVRDAAARRRSSTNPFRRAGAGRLGVVASPGLYDTEIRRSELDRYAGEDTYQDRFDSVFGIRSGQHLARLGGGLFTAAAAVVLAIALGLSEDPSSIGVTELALYVVIAQFAASAISRLGVGVASFSRHERKLEAYLAYSADGGDATASAPRHAGEVWAVLDGGLPDRLAPGRWLSAIGVDPSTPSAVLIEPDDLPDVPVAHLASGGRVERSEYAVACAAVAELVGRPLTEAELEATGAEIDDEELRAALTFGPALARRSPMVVIVPVRSLRRLRRRAQPLALDLMGHHHVVLAGRPRDHLLDRITHTVGAVDVAGFDDEDDEDDA